MKKVLTCIIMVFVSGSLLADCGCGAADTACSNQAVANYNAAKAYCDGLDSVIEKGLCLNNAVNALDSAQTNCSIGYTLCMIGCYLEETFGL